MRQRENINICWKYFSLRLYFNNLLWYIDIDLSILPIRTQFILHSFLIAPSVFSNFIKHASTWKYKYMLYFQWMKVIKQTINTLFYLVHNWDVNLLTNINSTNNYQLQKIFTELKCKINWVLIRRGNQKWTIQRNW
jgi:hypothetical protein